MSTWTAECTKFAYVIRSSTPRSLCLVDEFGQSADSLHGAAIFASSLRHFLLQPSSMPLLIATTHFHELFHFNFLPESAFLICQQMKSMIQSDFGNEKEYQENQEEQTMERKENLENQPINNQIAAVNNPSGGHLIPLYQLIPGVAPSSYGLYCAASAGLPPEILQRAHDIHPLIESHRYSSIQVPDQYAEYAANENQRMREEFDEQISIRDCPSESSQLTLSAVKEQQKILYQTLKIIRRDIEIKAREKQNHSGIGVKDRVQMSDDIEELVESLNENELAQILRSASL
jgi:DNA mismatch repair ATPase MutS